MGDIQAGRINASPQFFNIGEATVENFLRELTMRDEWRLAPLTTVEVRRFDATASDKNSRVVLSAFIHATNGVLSDASFSGEYVDPGSGPVFKSALKQSGDVEANLVSALRKRGAQYLPSATDEFLAALNLKRFSGVLGPLQEARARFSVVPVEVTRDVEFWPSWVVDIKTSLPSGGSRCFFLLVNPLSLRTTRISSTECKPSAP